VSAVSSRASSSVAASVRCDVCKVCLATHGATREETTTHSQRARDWQPVGRTGTLLNAGGSEILGRTLAAPGLVRHLYAWEFQTPSCRSVRARKTLLAEQIDATGSRTRYPRILSLASGHLREAREATLLLDRGAGAFFAVDQDAETLATVAAEFSAYGVDAVHGSVRGVLARKVAYTNLDLVYAAGLYDYLAEPLAIQLTARLFAMLRSGGRLVIPNFNPSLRDVGYLEAFMDWWLLYRDDEDMNRLVAAIPEAEIGESRQYRDRHGNITVIEVSRR